MALNREKTPFRDGHHRMNDRAARLCGSGRIVEGEVTFDRSRLCRNRRFDRLNRVGGGGLDSTK
jgi:hypothetical protein